MSAFLAVLWLHAAIAWGVQPAPVWFTPESAGAYGVSVYTAAAARMDETGVCQVLIFPSFSMDTPEATGLDMSQEEIWTRMLEHEMGHCLGFPDGGDGVMSDWQDGVTAADLSRLHR